MPAYLTHAIMGNQIYEELNNKKINRIPLSKDSLKTFSLGVDLSGLSKECYYKSHNEKTYNFFNNMIEYIKKYNLYNDLEVMSFLYGHISHYFLDSNCHPLIYYNEKELKNVTIIPNHYLIEGYISYYVCKHILKEDYMKISPSFFNQGNIEYKENVKLIKYLYKKIYNHNIITSYYATPLILSLLEKIRTIPGLDLEKLVHISGFDRFLKSNNINEDILLNTNNDKWKNPFSGDIHHESFIDLYKLSIKQTLEAIKIINEYLYDDQEKKTKSIFKNLSYDTGLNCHFNHKLRYKRKE